MCRTPVGRTELGAGRLGGELQLGVDILQLTLCRGDVTVGPNHQVVQSGSTICMRSRCPAWRPVTTANRG